MPQPGAIRGVDIVQDDWLKTQPIISLESVHSSVSLNSYRIRFHSDSNRNHTSTLSASERSVDFSGGRASHSASRWGVPKTKRQ
eukprot:scaffold386062_cov33-Prasinocladus_malaysianus.AAC.1